MKYILYTLVLLLHVQSTAQPLTRIYKNGKIGYIDSNGHVVIPPAFPSAGEFNEGLAPARMGGLYGYIDSTGKYIIPPQFDYAQPFYNGVAVVYKDRFASYIDLKGTLLFNYQYRWLSNMHKGLGEAMTLDSNYILVNKDGAPVNNNKFSDIWFDTIYSLAIVKDADNPKLTGLINTEGKFIIPYEKYTDIRGFSGEYSLVTNRKDKLCQYGVINSKGELQYYINESPDTILQAHTFSLGYVGIRINTTPGKEVPYGDLKIGFRNPKGNVSFNDSMQWIELAANVKRCFYTLNGKNYMLADENGKRIGTSIYGQKPDRFINNKAIVKIDNAYYFIDTNGNKISSALAYGFITGQSNNGDCIYYQGSDPNGNGSGLYGVADANGNEIIKPTFESVFLYTGFTKGLLAGIIGSNKTCYINRKGEKVWRERSTPSQRYNLDVDYKRTCRYFIYEGGKDTVTAADNFPENQLSITITTKEYVDNDSILYHSAYIANTTSSAMYFHTMSSDLDLVLQAKDAYGHWSDIECMPRSFCGNAYYGETLEAKNYWTVYIPAYKGTIKTQLRAKLSYADPLNKKDVQVLYSSAFEGTINPSQFWRESGESQYFPLSPYHD